MSMEKLTVTLKTLTPIWTGGVDSRVCDRIHETGIIGSLRWWYEAIVRGLGGRACDPSSKGEKEKCSFNTMSFQKTKNLDNELKKLCPVCQMFGCTGWSKKFRFSITDKNDIGEFSMIFKEIKEFDEEEKWLLIKTFEIITKYGSIGGKTVFKPSENPKKNTSDRESRDYRFHHQDFGLIEKVKFPPLPSIEKEKIKEYIKRDGQTNQPGWPDLRYFWFVKKEYFKKKKYIDREEHNLIVSRDPQNPKYYLSATPLQQWLGGNHLKGISKKIFSFYTHPRCWGYAKKGEYDSVIDLITTNSSIKKSAIIKGEDIINGF